MIILKCRRLYPSSADEDRHAQAAGKLDRAVVSDIV